MTLTSQFTGRPSSEASGTAQVLAALRGSTAERHELLHRIMPLSVDTVALRDYVAHLAILREWLAPLQAWLALFDDGPQSPDAAPRMNRVALIDADLSHESVRQGDRPRAASPTAQCAAWTEPRSAAYRWGVCYVIEGSQLGGAVLYARLSERLAPHPLRFLDAGRDALGPRWRAFTDTMAAQLQTPDAVGEACRGAAAAFDDLIALARRAGRVDNTTRDAGMRALG